MGVMCGLIAVPEEVARLIIDAPHIVHEFFPIGEFRGTKIDLDQVMSLEENWPGIQYALTGSPWGGDEPLNFLTAGGLLEGDEHVSVLHPDAVSRLDLALRTRTDGWFRQRFDMEAFRSGNLLYKWDLSDLLDDFDKEYGHGGMFRMMKAFVQRAAERGHAMIVTIE